MDRIEFVNNYKLKQYIAACFDELMALYDLANEYKNIVVLNNCTFILELHSPKLIVEQTKLLNNRGINKYGINFITKAITISETQIQLQILRV